MGTQKTPGFMDGFRSCISQDGLNYAMKTVPKVSVA